MRHLVNVLKNLLLAFIVASVTYLLFIFSWFKDLIITLQTMIDQVYPIEPLIAFYTIFGM